MKIKIGIVGYGNIGKGVLKAVEASSDMELVAVFTRRDPGDLVINNGKTVVYSIDDVCKMVDNIDVMLLCGGSATDLPEQGPYFAGMFNIVDSYDNHAKIPEYMASIDEVAKNKTAIISTGWDPGVFSLMRVLFESVLPNGMTYTFYGRGVSQGHSNAIRKIKGVKDAVQYTVPIESAVNEVRAGTTREMEPRQRMMRECYVVVEDDADTAEIEKTIKAMPNYFADYNTTVTFITEQELKESHSAMPHGGMVLRSGYTGKSNAEENCTEKYNTNKNSHVMEYSLKLESNPEFTASIMVAYARAVYRLAKEKNFGAKTVFDVPLTYLSEKDRNTLIKELL